MYFGLMNFIWGNNMDNYAEVIRMLRELTLELANDNTEYENRKEAEANKIETTEEKEDD